MFIKNHINNNRGDANVSKMTLIAIAFVVGAILLVLTTSAFKNPINNWFEKVSASWFADENGNFAYNDPYIMYERNANGSYKGLNYRLTYSDGSYVEIYAEDIANFPNGTLNYETGGYYGGENEDVIKNGWLTLGTYYDVSNFSLSADGKTLILNEDGYPGYCEFVAYIPEN